MSSLTPRSFDNRDRSYAPPPAITMADVCRHRRMCTAKRKRFHTALDGRLYVIRRKFKSMRIYPCPYCSGFHMSSKP